MYPLNFKEYMSAYSGTVQAGFNEYMLYGGLPQTEQIGQYVGSMWTWGSSLS